MPAELQQLHSDLDFVRQVVDRSENRAPAAIYLLWAAVILVGFPLADFRPEAMGTFWSIACPLGWVISAVLAIRHTRRTGQTDRRIGLRHAMHWGAMLIAVFLAALMAYSGYLSWPGMGPTAILIVSLGYVLAGIHLDRLLLWPGLLMGAGYLVLLFVPTWPWTIVGVLVCAGLVVSALSLRGPRAAAAHS